MSSIKIAVKYPAIPTINKSYHRGGARVFKDKHTKDYQDFLFYSILAEMRKNKIKTIESDKVKVCLKFGVKNLNRDLDNMIKSTLDSLQGVAIKNDKQVYAIEAYKEKTKDTETETIEIIIEVL